MSPAKKPARTAKKPVKNAWSFRITDYGKALLEQLAQEQGIPMSAVLEQAIRHYHRAQVIGRTEDKNCLEK